MWIDYHTHCLRCGHAVGHVNEYVARARELGLAEIGCSDHCPWMPHDSDEKLTMGWEEVAPYVSEVLALKEQLSHNGRRPFTVRLGYEIDYAPGRMDGAQAIIDRYPWDYLMGSVHFIQIGELAGPSSLRHYEKHRSEEICEQYFEQIREMIEARFCDVIAHLDLPKKFGRRPARGLRPYVEPLVPAMLDTGIAVEVNTSGLDLPCAEPLPGWELLPMLIEAGVPLVLGSDAHRPDQVARHFGPVVERLVSLGLTHLVSFERRRPALVPIKEV